MSVFHAIILGIVQGVAEFLPISSSGHLSILNNLFGLSSAEEGHLFFDVLLHFGTLVSICVVYWNDIVDMLHEVLGILNRGPIAEERRERYPAARLFFMIIVATLPLLLVLPFKDMLEVLYYNNYFIGVSLLLTGCLLYVSDKMSVGRKTGNTMTVLDALIVGLCQSVAIIPGLSRSGTTISAGIATGMKREFAVKFSFLLSLPAVFGANILSFADAFKSGIDWNSVPAYLVGTAVSMVLGIASLSLLKQIVSKGKFGNFAYYCWLVGVLSIILTMIF